MTSLGWSVVTTTAHLLEPGEREAVLGDICEAKGDVWSGLSDVTGLAIRRQLQLWKDWRPWLAAFGLTLPCSFLFMGFSLSVSAMIRALPHGSGAWTLLNQAALLAICAWSSGFVASRLSRRTMWVSAVACLLPCLFCLSRFGVQSQSRWELLLFLLPGICGVWAAYRKSAARSPIAQGTALTLVAISTGLVLAGPGTASWSLTLVLMWPGWFLAATAQRQSVTA